MRGAARHELYVVLILFLLPCPVSSQA